MKKDSPTPNLAQPKSRNQIFTYSENKLLDQITLEIMEAWKKDLLLMRKTHSQALETSKKIKNVTDDFMDCFPKIEKLITSEELINFIPQIRKYIEEINLRLGEIDKNIFEIEKKLNYPDFKKMLKLLTDIEEKINILNIYKNKRWWHIFK